MSIRVLEVIPTLRRAGAENMVASLTCRLDRNRFEPAVVSLYDPFPNGLKLAVRVWHLGKRRGPDPRMIPRLAAVFRDFRPDIVHTHSYVLRYTLPAGWLARSGAMVHTVHNVAGKESGLLGRAIQRFAFRHGVTAVAVAVEVARSFREAYGFPPAATIPNGIDTQAFLLPEARLRWRSANGFGGDDVLITSVARLEPQKNPLALIEAFAQADEPRARLLMAGEGSLLEAARLKAEQRGMAGRVRFLGVRGDVPELLCASDVFVLASGWEGHPLSVMEAMAAGLPVVATSVGGVPELVSDGVTGILVPPGDVCGLARALASLAADPQRRRELGAAGRAASAHFDVNAMVAAYAALFEEVLRR